MWNSPMYIHAPILDAVRALDQAVYTRSAAKPQVAPTWQDLVGEYCWAICGALRED